MPTPVLEREDAPPSTIARDWPWPWDDGGEDSLSTPSDHGAPPAPPWDIDWDDHGGDGDGDEGPRAGTWARRLLAVISILVLLSMIASPVAANLLAGHPAH